MVTLNLAGTDLHPVLFFCGYKKNAQALEEEAMPALRYPQHSGLGEVIIFRSPKITNPGKALCLTGVCVVPGRHRFGSLPSGYVAGRLTELL
jgi:hypothetical protein